MDGTHVSSNEVPVSDNPLKKSRISYIKKGKEHVPLKVLSLNARGLTNKYPLLQNLLEEEQPDIIAITETFLDKSIDENEFTPQGFKAFRKDRVTAHYRDGTYVDQNRGGVLLLIKEDLNPDEHPASSVKAELLWVSIEIDSKNQWLIGVCYRPEVDEDFMLEKINSSINAIDNQNVLLLGDFNFRNINWENETFTRPIEQSFIDTINDNQLQQIIDIPTRGENILDLAFVGDASAVQDYYTLPPLGNSDHKIVAVELKCLIPRVTRAPRKVYLYSKGNYSEMDDYLGSTDWDQEFKHKDINENWEVFKNKYNECLDKFIPTKMVSTGQRLTFPWARYKSVVKEKKKYRKAKVRARKSGLNADLYLAEDAKTAVENSVLEAKGHYENKLTDQIKENPKRFFNYARHFSRSSSTIDVLEENGIKTTDDTKKAEMLNNFFISVNTDETPLDSSHLNMEYKAPTFILRDIEVTLSEVRKKLCKLKANKASGPDNISINVLRNCPNFDVPLQMIFSKSVDQGIVPQDWRDANVSPLFKKGSRKKTNNYRPVSLTSQVVKLLERIIYDHIFKLLLKNGTISCDQHGFQEGCSCVTQLLECLHDWTLNFNDFIQTDIIYLDFAKAFDTVPHERLLLKLKNCGIRGKCLNWIRAFLSSRRQRVIMRNGISSWQRVKSGVPQGSILGPLLFLIYVNDMPDVVASTAKMFADDTKVYRKIKVFQDCHDLQDDLNNLSAWSAKWLLGFNETKCVALKIRRSIEYMYTLNGHILESVDTQKDLGVLISSDLKPSEHISSIVKKANSRIGLIKRCFTDLTKDKITTLYQAIVRPILEYASPAWAPHLKKDVNLLESAQRRCLRLSREPISLQSLAARRRTTDLCEVYKYINNLYKNGMTDMFTLNEIQLRGNSRKLVKKFRGTTIRQQFFSERTINDWNGLPDEVVTAPSLACFKRRLRLLPSGKEQ